MSSPAAYILQIQPNRREIFDEEFSENGRFGDAVPTFQHSSLSPLICFLMGQPGLITHVGKGLPSKGRNSAGTGLRTLHVIEIVELKTPIVTASILPTLDKRILRFAEVRLSNGGIIGGVTFQRFIDSIRSLSSEAAALLKAFSIERRARIAALSQKVRGVLAAQKDTVAVALNIADIRRDELFEWDPVTVNGAQPESFLDGLESVRLREDPMIIHDGRRFPGLDEIRSGPHSSTVFSGNDCVLTVLITNRFPLEEVTGADLIYFNETYKSCVMVQYKAMSDDQAPVFRPSNDDNLSGQIGLMRSVLEQLAQLEDFHTKDDFRLTQNPFFLKFCPRVVLNPDSIELIPGMYVPLDLWSRFETDPLMVGPNGGRVVSHENIGRYMNNTEFASLVSKAWIGTTHSQSEVLTTFIRDTVASGRSVTFAVEEKKTS